MDDLFIKDCGSYFTISNLNGEHENHCHINNKNSAELFKKQVERKIVPRGSYFRSCALRVTIDENVPRTLVTLVMSKWHDNN